MKDKKPKLQKVNGITWRDINGAEAWIKRRQDQIKAIEQGPLGQTYRQKALLLSGNRRYYNIVCDRSDPGVKKDCIVSDDELSKHDLLKATLLRNLFLDFRICFPKLIGALKDLLPSDLELLDEKTQKPAYVPVNSFKSLLQRQDKLRPKSAYKKELIDEYIHNLRDQLADIVGTFTKCEEPEKDGVFDMIAKGGNEFEFSPDFFLMKKIQDFLKALYFIGEEEKRDALYLNCGLKLMGLFGGPTSDTQKYIEACQHEMLAVLKVILKQYYGDERKEIVRFGSNSRRSINENEIFNDFIYKRTQVTDHYNLGNVLEDNHMGFNRFVEEEIMTREQFSYSKELAENIETRLKEQEEQEKRENMRMIKG